MVSFSMWMALFLVAASQCPTSTVSQWQGPRLRQQYSQHPPRPQPQLDSRLEDLRQRRPDPRRPDPPSSGCPVPDGGGYQANNGNCFYFSLEAAGTVLLSWSEARKKCQVLGRTFHRNTDLAELGGSDRHRLSDQWLMEKMSTQGKKVWLGAYNPSKPKKVTDGGWVWVHEDRTLPLNFPFWANGEPNNVGGDQWCVDAFPFGKGAGKRLYLNDEKCQDLHHYVCQFF